MLYRKVLVHLSESFYLGFDDNVYKLDKRLLSFVLKQEPSINC
ncbi:hypothetical protein VCHA50P415_230031 [Vibrio chagasii]|nr:hypothetical protein VCHA35P150_260038 [Vibrio chagasii]CAH7063108.1 hypothetical protein VCHA50P415_230031 [Vibrio chagasii]CAH7231632.1 hypothetical protein VCHA54P499_300034 [Vibrio chagasii]CAH7269828.1 hypothetical protein VCHA38O206_320002 [Vibrio chagasii]CAH7270939.1 hypothetical protein VCHA53O466_340002 [Vibrio chagasii]